MAELILKTLTKTYIQAQPPAVDQLNLAVRDGEFTALLGPSGCGKSTTLRMIAGLESVTAGEIRVGGKLVNELHPKDRGVGLAFENYALYPPLKVRDNLAFNLRAHGLGVKEINRRVDEIARTLQIQELLDLKPVALSSGQKQRDRKSTRLNSSHTVISYAVFCLKKKNNSSTVRSRSDQ